MIALWLAISAFAASPSDVRACLAANDVPCAEAAVQALGGATSSDPIVLALAADTAFYAGRYDDAATLIDKASQLGWKDNNDIVGLYHRTSDVTQEWAEVRGKRFIVRYKPGIDAVLLDDAQDTLVGAETHIAPLLGGPPVGPTILELYPNESAFVDASSLPKEAVETTGVVALSKWSRLLALSPRSLGRGYGWRDTIAHEYTHLVVAHYTNDRAPVWLQEAIARYLESRWRDGKDHFHLTPRDEALIADAIAEEGGKISPEKQKAVERAEALKASGEDAYVHVGLVKFEQMHPSLALLPSPEMAALAYAQLATLMAYCFEQGGDDVLLTALPAIKGGVDPREALAKAAGKSDFAALQRDWFAWLKTQSLQRKNVPELLTNLDGAAPEDSDPVMARRGDLRRYLRLGDLLMEADHPEAALVEYAKALDPEEPPSPVLSNSIAQAHLELGQLEQARKALEESLEFYPEFALSHKTLGEIQAKTGQTKAALISYRLAADLNPFDGEVQAALVTLATALGDKTTAARHQRDATILKQGGLPPAEVQRLHPLSQP